ncbi:uncharacterized protein LOC135485962 [Lineus longissimus]|uniref:uncharacterized protein LOC135485962 n=1 Tax=Lineus longissimus TaxID=88925 RepID=UPI00315C9774
MNSTSQNTAQEKRRSNSMWQRGRKKKGLESSRFGHLNQFRFKPDVLPWNKDLKVAESPPTLPPITRVDEETLPVSRKFDFNTSQKLRPTSTSKRISEYSENVVISMEKEKTLLKMVHEHAKSCSSKAPPELTIERRRGLLVFFALNCRVCHGKLPESFAMTDEIESSSGPAGSQLNEQLTLACMKSSAGIQDLRLAVSALNVTPPSPSTLYRKLNKNLEKVIKINEESMKENQRLCRQDALDLGQLPVVEGQTDAAFNNRCQSGYEAATQSFCGLIEEKHGLVLAVSTANKLCRRQNCKHDDCCKTYDSSKTISSSERSLAEENLKKVTDNGVVLLSSLTSDASSQLEKLVKDVNDSQNNPHAPRLKHFYCLVHRMRTFQKASKAQLKLKSLKDSQQKGKFLAALRRRIFWEIKWGTTKGRSTEIIYRAVANSVQCFRGNHAHCRKNSLVCNGCPRNAPRYLPHGKYVALSTEEALNVLAVINKYFTPAQLETLHGSKTTNQCENLHSMVFRYAPKGSTYARNFKGLSHSATHTKTFGPGRSTKLIAKRLNLIAEKKTPFTILLELKDKKANYDASRQLSKRYKTMRYVNKRRKVNRAEATGSAYQHGDVNIDTLHTYAFRPS